MVRVRLFAALRERAGWSERELDGVKRVADVWAALGLGEEPPGLLYAVNREYAPRERELADGDEVALIPPVSGGAFRLSDAPLSLDAVVDEVRTDEARSRAARSGSATRRSRSTRSSTRSAPSRPARSRPSSGRRACTRAAGRSRTSSTRPTRAWPKRS
jgi:molybdopterin converting factor small subunit